MPGRSTLDNVAADPRPHVMLMRNLADLLEQTAALPAAAAMERLRAAPDRLLDDALRERVTDLHLDPQSQSTRIRFRLDGQLLDVGAISHELGNRIIRHFQALSGMDSGGQFHPADARLTLNRDDRQVDLRITCAPTVCGEKMAMRLLDHELAEQKLDELGLSQNHRQTLEQWLTDGAGMLCIAGATGTGKTTTAYALLHAMKDSSRGVLTVEDPVEYQLDGIVQMQVDRRHEMTFANTLRSVLRLDPDCVMIGEIRDAGSARAAIDIAAAGRACITTVHAPDAIAAIANLRHFGVAGHELSATMRLVVAQRLVRKLCPDCRTRRTMTDAEAAWLEHVGLPVNADQLWHPTGCEACHGMGYRGRTAVFELWHLSEADRLDLLHHLDERAQRKHARERGLRPLLEDGYRKAVEGVTSFEELQALGAGYPSVNSDA